MTALDLLQTFVLTEAQLTWSSLVLEDDIPDIGLQKDRVDIRLDQSYLKSVRDSLTRLKCKSTLEQRTLSYILIPVRLTLKT